MLIRYPGSKDRQADLILRAMRIEERKLCEPFAGTAAVTFECLRRGLLDQAWINDADRGIFDLWCTIRDYPEQLTERVAAYRPAAEDFYCMRETEYSDPGENAFVTIVLHQISYSGLGRRAGSPIGGREQTGKYTVGCRWNAGRIATCIREAHSLMRKARITITNLDWTDCPAWTWYVDPPYAVAGSALYREGVFPVRALANDLYAKAEWWVLSYDDAPEVQAAYDWAHIDHGGRTYLGNGNGWANRSRELLITPRDPQVVLF